MQGLLTLREAQLQGETRPLYTDEWLEDDPRRPGKTKTVRDERWFATTVQQDGYPFIYLDSPEAWCAWEPDPCAGFQFVVKKDAEYQVDIWYGEQPLYHALLRTDGRWTPPWFLLERDAPYSGSTLLDAAQYLLLHHGRINGDLF